MQRHLAEQRQTEPTGTNGSGLQRQSSLGWTASTNTSWKNAEELAKEDAAENSTTLDEVARIDYETETIDDDAEFEEDYEAWAEFEWECQNDR